MPGTTRGGKKPDPPTPVVAPIFQRRGLDDSQDGGRIRGEDTGIDSIPGGSQPASRADISQILARMGDMQTSLAMDIAKIATEVRAEVGALGLRIGELEEGTGDLVAAHNALARTTDTLSHRMDRMELALEDVANRSRRNNIRLRGLPESVQTRELHETVLGLLKRLVPEVPPAKLLMDRIHRALRAPRADSQQPRDVIFRLHYYTVKEEVMRKSRDVDLVYEDVKLALFQDLAPETLQRRRAWRPITAHLGRHNIRYAWGFPFKLLAFAGGKTSTLTLQSDPQQFFTRLDCPPLPDAGNLLSSPSPAPQLTPRWEKVPSRIREEGDRDPG
uniref:Uncharacterized protein n=2 Tax=Leptobrachium leishanense TaxID=445787 RepID=A0A8C5PLJ3_9ANUR